VVLVPVRYSVHIVTIFFVTGKRDWPRAGPADSALDIIGITRVVAEDLQEGTNLVAPKARISFGHIRLQYVTIRQ
jgi:hypothetical protein